jgi:hypothetical protein
MYNTHGTALLCKVARVPAGDSEKVSLSLLYVAR